MGLASGKATSLLAGIETANKDIRIEKAFKHSLPISIEATAATTA